MEHLHLIEGMAWLSGTGREILIMGLPMLLAVTFHELAHGVVANRFGDPSARLAGRLTLNPLAHVDPFGTILLPLMLVLLHTGFLFGYAKPVPVNPGNLRHPRRDMVFVALAGPLSNLLQAFLFMSALHGLAGGDGGFEDGGGARTLLSEICRMGIEINVVLFVFNLIPLPPLDGGRVLSGLLPPRPAMALSRIEPYGVFLVMGLVILDPYLGIMSRFVWPVMGALTRYIVTLAGT